MKFLQSVDSYLLRLIDEIGFFMQVRARVSRFYLVPLLNIVSLFIAYVDGSHHSVFSNVLTMLTFVTAMGFHFFGIHTKGSETDDMTVNLAVENLRSSDGYLLVRTFGICLFTLVAVIEAFNRPWLVVTAFIQIYFTFYPVMIFQKEPPPKRGYQDLVVG